MSHRDSQKQFLANFPFLILQNAARLLSGRRRNDALAQKPQERVNPLVGTGDALTHKTGEGRGTQNSLGDQVSKGRMTGEWV